MGQAEPTTGLRETAGATALATAWAPLPVAAAGRARHNQCMTNNMPGPSPQGYLGTLRMLAAAFLGATVLVVFAMTFVIPSESWFEMPDMIGFALPIVVGVLAFGGVLTVGHQTPAIPQGTPPDQASAAAKQHFQTTMFVRLAFAEVPLFAGIAAAFLSVDPSLVPVLIGAVIALILHLSYAFPHAASVRRVERRLDRDGGRSGLAEALGMGAGPMASGYTGGGTVL